MNKKKLKDLEIKLKAESATLEIELTDIGYLHPADTNVLEDRQNALEVDSEDKNILADKFEETTTDAGITRELLARYESVQKALEKIKKNTYGICSVCKEEISEDRLNANPSADTCIEHAK